jgi:hypothetical protein
MNELRSFGKALLTALALTVALGLAACKGNNDDTGTVQVGLTDAPGDFLSYTVDVTSLTLTKADGTVIETLPQRTRVDLAQLTDLTEFVTGATIPAGIYVGATLNLDYAAADLEVDDGTGAAVPVPLANIHDALGNPVTTMTMNVRLDNARQLTVAPFVLALLDLDFNLAASNAVDMTNPLSPVVTVSPLLVADVNPDAPKPHRIRGPLDQVNVQGNSFTLILRPFNLIQGDHGRLTFVTGASTAFEINQVASVGSAGLTALSQLQRLSAVVALGTFVPGTRQFLATEVRAGSSVAFGTNDVLSGNVISRSNNIVKVKGAELVRNDGTLIFRDTVDVTVGAGTKVIKQGSSASVTIADISVGQRVMIFGTLDAPGTSMAAAAGLVRLLVTQLNGTVSAVSGATVGMTLARIDGRPISLFDFTGTGTPGNDADPTAYLVSAGSLPLGGIGNGTPVKVRGFPQPFGQATASVDFNAVTLIDVTNAPATLLVGWPLLEAVPFGNVAPNSLRLNLTNAGLLHDVIREGVDTRLLTGDTPTVQTTNLGRGLFVIAIDGTVQVYTQFSAYQQALQADLAAGRKARAFVASGGINSYIDATKTLTAGAIAAVLH